MPNALDEAKRALGRRDFITAEQFLNTALRESPNSYEALHLLAIVARNAGRLKQSRQVFERAILLSGGLEARIHADYGDLLAEQGDVEGALEHYNAALRLQPHYGEVLVKLGWLHLRAGNFLHANATFGEAVRVTPNDARGWHGAALTFRGLHEFEPAAEAIDRAVALEPGDAALLYARALVAAERGEVATGLYQTALKIAPDALEIQLGEAVARYEEGDCEAGISALERISEANPGWAPAHTALAKLSWESGMLRDFTRGFTRALIKRPDDPELRVTLIAVLMKAGQFEEARRAIEAARVAVGDAAWFDEAEAVCSSELGDLRDADALFERLGDQFENGGLAVAHARHLLRSKRIDAAAARAWEAVRRPGGGGGWPYLATAWRLLEDPRWEWLEGDPRLIGVIDLPVSTGELEALATFISGLHVSLHHPFDQTLRGGTQSAGSLLDRSDPPIAELKSQLRQAVAQYISELPPPDASHPVLSTPREPFHFSGSWSSLLRAEGRHTQHVHPGGWISSAFYVSVPPSLGRQVETPHGWLALGQPPEELGLDVSPLRLVEPKPGRLALFPSIMWHGTRPFPEGERMTIAFDAVPSR